MNNVKMEMVALVKFWQILLIEENTMCMGDKKEAYEMVLELAIHPIDTRFCLSYDNQSGWWLHEASGTKIINTIEGGELK